jgi:hypothetical protein
MREQERQSAMLERDSQQGLACLQTGGGPIFEPETEASQAFGLDSNVSEAPEGFYLEYVIQAQPSSDGRSTPQPGPHVLEIAIQHAKMTWPYMCQMDFIWDIAEVFSRYVMQPYVSPYPVVSTNGLCSPP